MKHRVTWLSVLPLALAMVSLAEAGFRCGGCSDPCRSVRSNAACNRGVASVGMSVNGGCSVSVGGPYASYSIVEASPASCGAVAADGSYAMSPSGMSYGQMSYGMVSNDYGQISSPSMGVATAPCESAMHSTMSVGPQVVCEPVTGYRTVMESTFVTETQYVTVMETKQETRSRVRKVSRSVPVTVEDYRTKTVMVPTTETKTIEYTVLVPEQSTKTVDVQVSVPVWNEIAENYTVKVPTISDVQETYNVNVARLKDETFTYNVFVPQVETVTKMQTVTNAVPVVKTRTVQRAVPSYSTQSVTKDYGHWETVVEEVAGSCYGAAPVVSTPAISHAMPTMSYTNGCGNASMATTVVSGGGCGNAIFSSPSTGCNQGCSTRRSNCGCSSCGNAMVATNACATNACGSSIGSACGGNVIVSGNVVYNGTMTGGCAQPVAAPRSMTTTRRVWVPNVVNEEVSVVTNTYQNEEVSYTVYEQQSTQIPYECAYVAYKPEQRTGTKKVVEYVPEARTRTRKVVSYNDEQRTRTRRVLSYKTETKQETYPVVTYRTEKKTKEISFTVNVPTQTVEPFQTTRYETETDDVVEDYTVNVQVPTTKEVQVQVCKMVPKLVAYTFNPCAGVGASSGVTSGTYTNGAVGGCGCGASVPVMTAPSNNCGCSTGVVSSPCNCAR